MEQLTRPWAARVLRLTMFLHSSAQIGAGTWAQATAAGEPAFDHAQPPQLIRTLGGPVEPGFLTLQLQGLAQRLDWIMGAPPPSASSLNPFEFGPVDSALKVFNTIMRRWLKLTDVVANRLAIGIVAVIPTADQLAAYNELQRYLPSVKVDPEHSRELLYRINRPKPSRSLGADVELNRVTTWSVLKRLVAVAPINAALSPAGAPLPATPVALPGLGDIYVAVECDNSTPAERQSPLDRDQFVDIFDELIEMALQNLELGELP